MVLRLPAGRRRPAAFSQLLAFGLRSRRERYRISVKIEPHGAAGTYLQRACPRRAMRSTSARRAAALFCSRETVRWCCSARESARRRFWRCCTRCPRRGSTRQVLWLHAARDGQHHPFAAEARRLCSRCHGRSYVCYSGPDSRERMGENFDATGHLSRAVLDEAGVPREADIYLCGPTRFMADMKEALAEPGVAPERIHAEIFNGGESLNPGIVGAAQRAPHPPKEEPTPGRWFRLPAAASPRTGMRRRIRAFWSWPKRVTCRSAGRAAPAYVTTARAD